MITMIKEEYKYSELTGKIIKCAMIVHSTFKKYKSTQSQKSNKS